MKNFVFKISYIALIFVVIFAFSKVSFAQGIWPYGPVGWCDWVEVNYPNYDDECNQNGGPINDDDDDDDNNNGNGDEVITLSATNIDEDSAKLRGEVTDGNNVDVWFVLSRTDSTPSCSDNDIDYSVSGDYDDGDVFSRTVSNLRDDTKYYFRACTDDDSGSIRSFYTDEDNGNNNNDDDDDDNGSNGDTAVLTTDATAITTSSAILNGLVVNTDGNQRVWFEYGSTVNLGSQTASRTVNADQSLVSVQINGLSSARAYFFRIVTDDGERGDLRSFVTKSTSTGSNTGSNTGSTGNNSGSGTGSGSNTGTVAGATTVVNSGEYLNVDLVPNVTETTSGDQIAYAAIYENLTNTTLKNIRITIDFPEGLTPTKTENGNFISKQVIEVLIPSLSARSRGSFTIEVSVDRNSRDDEFMVSIIEASYDHPVTPNTTISTIDYSILKVFKGAVDQSASALFALGLFSLGFWGWLIIILLITIIILLARKVYKDKEDKKKAENTELKIAK